MLLITWAYECTVLIFISGLSLLLSLQTLLQATSTTPKYLFTDQWSIEPPFTHGMEMHSIQLHRPSRQRSLETQQLYHNPEYPQRQPLYKRMATRIRMISNGLREGNEVDEALAAAAVQHKRGDRFLGDYAQISHRSQLSLHKIFDLFVREPPATATS